jgi:hypothetical protein
MRRHLSQGLHREQGGFILFLVIVFTTLLGLASILAISGTLGAIMSAGNQLRDKRAFFQADGSAALCRRELVNRLQIALPARLATLSNITAVSPHVPNDPAGFLVQYAYQPGTSFGGSFIQDSAAQARLELTYPAPGAPGPYRCTLTVISRADPINLNQGSAKPPVYLFHYRYTIDGTATDGGLTRNVNLQGTFSVVAQNDNFARYALLTNQQTNASGSLVWFTNRTNFSGPVHTNGKFNFANNPGPLFTDKVTSVNSSANFYNNGQTLSAEKDWNDDLDVPFFGGGFNRGAPEIPIPTLTSADRQREAALGLPQGASTTGYAVGGVYLGTNSGAMTGGIYVYGNTTISLGVAGTGMAGYTINQGGTTFTVTVNYPGVQTTLQRAGGPISTYSGLPNGMLFVDGQVSSLAGTVQRDTELTVAATSDIIITNNLTYENYTPGASPSAEGATNLLGILSWGGNVRISTTAPNDISVHATVMSPTHEFNVDNYNSGSSRGTATILGGVIENTYGAFGTFSASGSNTGYGRNFVYDTRMKRGNAPPFFPTTGKVVGTVFGLNDRPTWRQTN